MTNNYLGLHVSNVNWESAHVTLMYFGSNAKTPSVEACLSHLQNYSDLHWYVQNMGVDHFGPNEDIPVCLVPKSVFAPLQRQIENIVTELGYPNQSSYPFNPHVTLPPVGTVHVPYLFKVEGLFLRRDGRNYTI